MDKLKLIEAILGSSNQTSDDSLWEIGKDYLIRTVTMIYIGKLEKVTDKELLLSDCAWIPETSRWNEFLNGKDPNEQEPYPNDVIIGRGAVLDATIMKKRPENRVI